MHNVPVTLKFLGGRPPSFESLIFGIEFKFQMKAPGIFWPASEAHLVIGKFQFRLHFCLCACPHRTIRVKTLPGTKRIPKTRNRLTKPVTTTRRFFINPS